MVALFHLWFVPIVGGGIMWLVMRKHWRDAILFFVLAVPAYVLWLKMAMNQPIIIIDLLEKIFVTVKGWWD